MMRSNATRGAWHPVLLLTCAGLAVSAPARADSPPSGADIRAVPQQLPDVSPMLSAQADSEASAVPAAPPEAPSDGATAEEAEAAFERIGEGVASYYGNELAGNRTANGERFDPNGLTAAHRTLPMGSKLRVTNKSNGKSVVVRVNDRGPFARGRILDVSLGAAKKIGMVRSGTARVLIDRIS
jgi:rare lipoprotein A